MPTTAQTEPARLECRMEPSQEQHTGPGRCILTPLLGRWSVLL